MLSRRGFQHEVLEHLLKKTDELGFIYQHASLEPIYFGLPRRLSSVLSPQELTRVSALVAGAGRFGRLLNGGIDLDNIDNVFRLAYHLGLSDNREAPCRLAESLYEDNEEVVLRDAAVDDLVHWASVRRRLYRYLLLNPDEFSAKCMLEDALLRAEKEGYTAVRWHHVDFQIVTTLHELSSETHDITARLMTGDLYGCAGIFESPTCHIAAMLSEPDAKARVERHLEAALRQTKVSPLRSASPVIHVIADINKTDRLIKLRTETGGYVTAGEASSRVLIGVFLRNKHLSMLSLSEDLQALAANVTRNVLVAELGDNALSSIPLFAEEPREAAKSSPINSR